MSPQQHLNVLAARALHAYSQSGSPSMAASSGGARHQEPTSTTNAPSSSTNQSSPSAANATTTSGGGSRGEKRRLRDYETTQPQSRPPAPPSHRSELEYADSDYSTADSNVQAASQTTGRPRSELSNSNGSSITTSRSSHSSGSRRWSRGQRDATRYETWTSKQLRTKCSRLKLRGLKNVKKHVMVEALYRYYRIHRHHHAGGSHGSDRLGGSTIASSSVNSDQSSPVHRRGANEDEEMQESKNNSNSSNEDSPTPANTNGLLPPSSQSSTPQPRSSDQVGSYWASRGSNSMPVPRRYPGFPLDRRTIPTIPANAGSSTSSSSRARQWTTSQKQLPSSSASSSQQPPSQSQPVSSDTGASARSASTNGARATPSSAQPPARMHSSSSAAASLSGSVASLNMNSGSARRAMSLDDMICLIDVIFSPTFVGRLTTELTRWQFWVDVRDQFIKAMKRNEASNAMDLAEQQQQQQQLQQSQSSSGSGGNTTSGSSRTADLASLSYHGYGRSTALWNTMQLWEVWNELTFAYTKTCFEFTTNGTRSSNGKILNTVSPEDEDSGDSSGDERERKRKSHMQMLAFAAVGSEERDFIKFCDHRPDVYYLHQRLHERPDLLHLVRSNDYVDDKSSSDSSESNSSTEGSSPPTEPRNRSMASSFPRTTAAAAAATSGAQPSGPVPLAAEQPHAPRGAPISSDPATSSSNNTDTTTGNSRSSGDTSGSSSSQNSGPAAATYNSDSLPLVNTHFSPSSQSTEESNSSDEEKRVRDLVAKQQHFALLLQNFEALFESLHNKKMLLAVLHKDGNAPEGVLADLEDDIQVLTSLKKQYRDQLREMPR